MDNEIKVTGKNCFLLDCKEVRIMNTRTNTWCNDYFRQ